MATLVFFGILIALREAKKIPASLSAIASALLVVFFLQYPVRSLLVAHRFEQGALALWFFGVGIATFLEVKIRSRGGDWEKTAFVALGIVSAFAYYYYPNLKASWGGGTPVSIMMQFTKDSAVLANQLSAQLVEESDQGYYIVGPNESKAIFVPRNAVALVYFSDKVADSALLSPKK